MFRCRNNIFVMYLFSTRSHLSIVLSGAYLCDICCYLMWLAKGEIITLHFGKVKRDREVEEMASDFLYRVL
jgi:hypothetical protein